MTSEKKPPRAPIQHTQSQHNYRVAFMGEVFSPFAEEGAQERASEVIRRARSAFMNAVWAVQTKHTDNIEDGIDHVRDSLDHLIDAVQRAEKDGRTSFHLAWSVPRNLDLNKEMFNTASGFARSVQEQKHNADALEAVAVNIGKAANGMWQRYREI